jgi:hypothetical protein
MAVGRRSVLALVLVLVLAAPSAGLAQDGVATAPLAEPRVAAAIEACGERTTEDFLSERLTAQGLGRPKTGGDEALGLAVDRALDPAKRPELAAAELADLAAQDGTQGRPALRYFTLRNFAYYEALTCQALGQWYRQLLIHRDLLQGAAPSDAKRDHYARAVERSRLKLALTLRQRDRLAEKERLARAAVGLGAP